MNGSSRFVPYQYLVAVRLDITNLIEQRQALEAAQQAAQQARQPLQDAVESLSEGFGPVRCGRQARLIRYVSQTYLPQPFGLSLSKPGRSLRAALRQAQGERACLRYVANQTEMAGSACLICASSYQKQSIYTATVRLRPSRLAV